MIYRICVHMGILYAHPTERRSAQVFSFIKPAISRFQFALRWIVPIIFLILLIRSLSNIGWIQVWYAKPKNPLFYFLQIFTYILLPISEWIIYRRLLTRDSRLTPSIFFQKRYLNAMVVEYSGEAYFFLWAKNTLGINTKKLMQVVRDSTLLSGAAGLVLLWTVILFFVLFGQNNIQEFLKNRQNSTFVIALLPLLPCLVIIFGRQRMTSLTHREMAWVFFMHLSRSVINFLLEILGWWFSGVLNGLVLCFDFVALRFVLSRLPFIPGKDLVFLCAGLELSGAMDLSRSHVAAVLIIMTIFPQVLDFLLVMKSRLKGTRKSSEQSKPEHNLDTLLRSDPDLQ